MQLDALGRHFEACLIAGFSFARRRACGHGMLLPSRGVVEAAASVRACSWFLCRLLNLVCIEEHSISCFCSGSELINNEKRKWIGTCRAHGAIWRRLRFNMKICTLLSTTPHTSNIGVNPSN